MTTEVDTGPLNGVQPPAREPAGSTGAPAPPARPTARRVAPAASANPVRAVLAGVRGLAGLALMVIGYLVLAESLIGYLLATDSRQRMDYVLSGGAIGLGLVLAGALAMVVEWINALPEAGRDPEGERVVQLLRSAAERRQAGVGRTSGSSARTGPTRSGRALVWASSASYHREGCRLVESRRDLEQISLAAARRRGLSACRLCAAEE